MHRSCALFLSPFLHTPASSLAHSTYSTACGLTAIRGGMWVKYSYVKISLLSVILPQEYQLLCQAVHHLQNVLFCKRTFCHLLAVVVAWSPTLWQVSVRTLAVMSLTALWWIEWKPPFGQFDCEIVATDTVRW